MLFTCRGHGRGGYKTNENVPYIYSYKKTIPKETIAEVLSEETKLEAEQSPIRDAAPLHTDSPTKDTVALERKRDLEKMRRSAQTAPPECLAKYMRERRNHKGLASLLAVWKEDPTWGKVVVSERQRLQTLTSKSRRYMWKMECQLHVLFPDPDYVALLVKNKANNKEECMANPQCPKVRKWDLYKVYEDCNVGYLYTLIMLKPVRQLFLLNAYLKHSTRYNKCITLYDVRIFYL